MPVEGICVRVSAMRCHTQALTIKLKDDIPLSEIERVIAGGNSWVKVIPNERELLDQGARSRSGQRNNEHSHRPVAQNCHGRGVSIRIYGRRSVVVGRRGALTTHDALPAWRSRCPEHFDRRAFLTQDGPDRHIRESARCTRGGIGAPLLLAADQNQYAPRIEQGAQIQT